jgi:hypothetical protein
VVQQIGARCLGGELEKLMEASLEKLKEGMLRSKTTPA